ASSSTTSTRACSSPMLAILRAVVARRFAARQQQREARAAARARLAADAAAMRLHDRAADRQSQPDTRRRAFLAATLELLEDRFLAAGRQPGPVVVDGHAHLITVDARADRDRTAGRRVLRGVLEQVDE